jgi:hypothetical protein
MKSHQNQEKAWGRNPTKPAEDYAENQEIQTNDIHAVVESSLPQIIVAGWEVV